MKLQLPSKHGALGKYRFVLVGIVLVFTLVGAITEQDGPDPKVKDELVGGRNKVGDKNIWDDKLGVPLSLHAHGLEEGVVNVVKAVDGDAMIEDDNLAVAMAPDHGLRGSAGSKKIQTVAKAGLKFIQNTFLESIPFNHATTHVATRGEDDVDAEELVEELGVEEVVDGDDFSTEEDEILSFLSQTCNKCTGDNACDNENIGSLNINDVACGSCIGDRACFDAEINSIGSLSCRASEACSRARTQGTIGSNSCNEELACGSLVGDIGDNSCNGERACYGIRGNVGSNSCNGYNACYRAGGYLEDIPDNCLSIAALEAGQCECRPTTSDTCGTPENKCIGGHNMLKVTDVSKEACCAACSLIPACLGIEWFTKDVPGYKAGDCMLSSSVNDGGCDNNVYKVEFYPKTVVH